VITRVGKELVSGHGLHVECLLSACVNSIESAHLTCTVQLLARDARYMRRCWCRKHVPPGVVMQFWVLDARCMANELAAGTYNAVMDKGTLDAMLCADDDEGQARALLASVCHVLTNGASTPALKWLILVLADFLLNSCESGMPVIESTCRSSSNYTF
jgi:hypothetical protein